MYFNKQRKAFSMITAIIVIVLMASVGAFVMSLSGKMVKETTTQFQREQAMLLAKSYTEYAIMAVMANNRVAGGCLKTINGDDIIRNEANGGFEVRVELNYISNNTGMLTGCAAAPDRVFSDAAVTPESALNIIVDVYVKYHDLDGAGANWITYHKRTLQKI